MPTGHGPAGSHAPATSSGSTSSHGAAAGHAASSHTAATADDDGGESSGANIPPKTRKYLKEKGLLDVAHKIPASGKKLMPEDVDAWLAKGGAQAGSAAGPSETVAAATSDQYALVPLPQSQIVLNYRLVRGTQNCVPVTVFNEIDWSRLDKAREVNKPQGGPTPFVMACWCVVQALKSHSRFRSSLTSDGRQFKVFHRVNLGIAVALPGDEMVTAVVRDADQMSREQFFQAVAKQIEIARDGRDQADESTTMTVSNIGKAGMRAGIPAIVTPAVATLAFGETYPAAVPDGNSFRFRASVLATLSFDHRIANGVGAANFMNDIKAGIESFAW
jgi:pyruvate dehydrogenase E2 component (dihydrolipoamide acetyltransferase)